MATKNPLSPFGITVGTLPQGPLGLITDVPGVLVGHQTINSSDHKTGVTVILPGPKNPFLYKHTAAAYVLNGFGKSTGLMQMEELGTLESPIALTNTLNVGLVQDGLVEYTIDRCKQDGYALQSFNPVVLECNDSQLNDIQKRAVTQDHVLKALQKASPVFELGDVGAGTGTVCYGFKGGIGSASRQIVVGQKTYTLGVLVQSNYGQSQDLRINGKGVLVSGQSRAEEDKGSIIMVLATDLPLDHRQLKRVIKRMSVGMARLGSYIGHGSGEVMVGFTTANTFYHLETREILSFMMVNEPALNKAFRAAGECCEEAILSSMLMAGEVTGYKGKKVLSLADFLTATPFKADF